ncbi:MAG: hypothetical protein BGP10_12345 [Rhodanobacter sp. 68-29]|nr:hypothetical protein [Rhodanobacter sp.]ODV27977.1 MAG: hypothetical protein ABT19_00265 [Rhodanobacter sp. SCN 68-63]OJY60681.1 MAG: hypothetical protein BGP10_12345 [Rhodanobacter sp. 68-29]
MSHHKSWPKKDYPKPWTPKKLRSPEKHLISDHALVRYMERVMRIDVERLRDMLISDGRAELIRSIGTGHLHLPDGATLVVLDCKVVSVMRTDELKQGARVRRPDTP